MDARSRSAFLLLSSLLSSLPPAASGEGSPLVPAELAPVPCNDKAVEKLSRLALTYINEDLADGYKFALNRIANVHLQAQGPAGNVYYLDLDVLETKCHIGSPKPWKRCDVRPFMETQISGNCNTTIIHTPDGFSYLYSYHCTLVPDSPEKLQQVCPTCPLLLATDSPQAVNTARLTLASYRRRSTLAAGLGVKKITRASAQVLPEKASFVEYTVHKCPLGVTERGTCQGLEPSSSDTEAAGFCAGSVRGHVSVHPEVHVSCEMFKLQNVDVLRPLQPQTHVLPPDPESPTFPPPTDDPGNDPQPVPSDPPANPAVQPTPFNPAPIELEPFDPNPVVVNPAPIELEPFDPNPVAVNPSNSSSSESSEGFVTRRGSEPFDSSSSSEEEVGGPLALRPPLNFRYQRRERKRRQALMETSSPHSPVFLSDFPSGLSPFRSCPGPARYTTV